MRVSKCVLCEDRLQFFPAHLPWLSPDRAEDAQDLGSLAVLFRRDLFEVGEGPVHLVAVEVVDLHAGSTWPDESLVDEMMAEAVFKIVHNGVSGAAFVVLHTGTKTGFELSSFGGIKLAVRAGEEDFAADGLKRHLFDHRYSHNASDSRR